MRTFRALRSHLLLALAGVSACAQRGPVEPEPERGSHEREPSGDSRFATPPPGDTANPEACQYALTRYCFAPADLHKILASCGAAHKQDDANGCMTRESYASCGASVVSGPSLEGALCCYQVCQPPALPGGRPLSTAEGQRRAPAIAREDWLARPRPAGEPGAPSEPARRALAAAWSEDALTEHASVASFARFTLELLCVGAPPELLERAQQGALDEIEHARLCFSLATRFGGTPLGPGPLDLEGVAPRKSLREVLLAGAVEGCVAETFGACLALRQLEHCSDPETRQVLERIAKDEAEHAALAWRFVAWALAQAPELADETRGVIERALARWAELRGDAPAVDLETWHHFGRLSPDEVAQTFALCEDEVIAPCLEEALRPLRAQPSRELAGAAPQPLP